MPAALGGTASASGIATSLTTGSITATPTAGSTLAVAVRTTRDFSTALTVSDNKSNTFTRVAGALTDTKTDIVIFRATNIATSAGHTVTVQFSDVNAISEVAVIEITGANTTDAFDVQAPTDANNSQATPGLGTDAVTSTAATTTADGEFILGVMYTSDQNDATVGTGFTDIITVNNLLRAEYKIQSSAGSIAATYTMTFDRATKTSMATFKATGGSPAGTDTATTGLTDTTKTVSVSLSIQESG